MRDKYDAVVVGAGPAGSMTAYTIANLSDKSVLLVDKKRTPGYPINCAGGIVKYFIDQIGMQIPPLVVDNTLRGAKIYGPVGGPAVLEAPSRGDDDPLAYIVNRGEFDRWLRNRAMDKGVVLSTGSDPSKYERPYDFRTKYLIGADGWRSQLGRYFEFPLDLPQGDVHYGIEYRVTLDEKIDPGFISMHLGERVAPAGYAWVFPENEWTVKIGLCAPGGMKSPRFYLDRFLKDHPKYSGANHGISAGGVIPTARPLRWLYRELNGMNIALVGDAARHTDPLHGGGIANGMTAGQVLGGIIAEDGLMAHYNAWFVGNLRKELRRRYALKQVLLEWDDNKLQRLVEVMKKVEITNEPITAQTRKFIFSLLIREPRLFTRVMWSALRAMFKR